MCTDTELVRAASAHVAPPVSATNRSKRCLADCSQQPPIVSSACHYSWHAAWHPWWHRAGGGGTREHWSAALAQPGWLWCDSSPALPHLLLFVGWAALFLGTLSDRPACHLPAAPSGPLASGRSSHTAGPSVCSCRGGCSSHASPQASPFLSGHPVTTSPFSVGTFVAGPSSVLHCSWAMYRLPCWGAGLVQTSNGDAPFGHCL